MPEHYRIGALATRLEIPVETIRYYEQQGLLLKPARTEGNYRLYTQTDVERLEFIRHCRALDMTLREIGQLLRLRDEPDLGCAEVNAMLDRHIEEIAGRVRKLRVLQDELKSLRALCESPRSTGDCRILQGLAEPAKTASRGK